MCFLRERESERERERERERPFDHIGKKGFIVNHVSHVDCAAKCRI
jgi:hypothetical protein